MKRVGIWTMIILLAAVTGGALSYKPWKAFLEQRSIAVREREAMDSAEKNRAKLARDKAELESHSGREASARAHGYIKKGEQEVSGG